MDFAGKMGVPVANEVQRRNRRFGLLLGAVVILLVAISIIGVMVLN